MMVTSVPRRSYALIDHGKGDPAAEIRCVNRIAGNSGGIAVFRHHVVGISGVMGCGDIHEFITFPLIEQRGKYADDVIIVPGQRDLVPVRPVFLFQQRVAGR